MNGTTYSYDSNGNMTHDGRRSLNVEYNLLNLPSEVENQADDMTARYTYLADATKLEVVDGDGCGYDYLGSLVYRKNDDDSYTLESTPFSGGRIVRNSSGSYRINGFVTDHLGSIRTVYDVETGDVIERNDYYPFGKRLNNSLAMSPTNRYRFSGKEQQIVANVNLLDFGARMYDDEICRWTTVDPLAEKYYSMTPYNYCANNPVMFVDPEGRDYKISERRKTITISQTLYYPKYDRNRRNPQISKEAAESAANFWNNQKSLKWNKKQIIFKIKPVGTDKIEHFKNNDDSILCDYSATMQVDNENVENYQKQKYGDEPNLVVNGHANDGVSYLREDAVNGTTPAHEEGHNLGMKHVPDGEKGLMSRINNKETRTTSVTTENIKEMMTSPKGHTDLISKFLNWLSK